MSDVRKTFWSMALLCCCAVVVSVFGVRLAMQQALVREADSRGMDWAHYIEEFLETQTATAKARSPANNPAFRNLLDGVFSVGHILQIDYFARGCGYCRLTFRDSDFHNAQSEFDHHHHQHGSHENEAGHDDLVAYIANTPLDIDRLEQTIENNAHDIFIRRGTNSDARGTFAEVFHPVQDDAGTAYVLRVVVDLTDQDRLFQELLATGVIVSLVILGTVIGLPTQRLVRSLQRQHEADKEAAYFANHDVLTSLPNRNSFQELAEDMIWRCSENDRGLVLFLFDLNGFKEVNDYYGHNVGDSLLCEFASMLIHHAPEDGLIARLGGDEFVIAFHAGPKSQMSPQEILGLPDYVELLLPEADTHVRAGISGGFALYPRDGDKLTDLMQSADLALYSAKTIAGGGVLEFQPHMRTAFLNRLTSVKDFRTALEHAQIQPFYQPIVNIETGEVAGFEALARWNHPDRGILTPGQFEDALEDNQICTALGKTMLAAVIADMEKWARNNVDFKKVGINVTTGDLLGESFAEDVLSRLRGVGLRPGALTIEVTENCLFQGEKSKSIGHLEKLRAAGCGIALDDFGTGYSSITRLKDVPISIVKIDKSFVDFIETDKSDQAIIGAMREMGCLMSFDVVVEGVETKNQAAYFERNAFRLAQGFLYSKPVPAADVPALIPTLESQLRSTRLAG